LKGFIAFGSGVKFDFPLELVYLDAFIEIASLFHQLLIYLSYNQSYNNLNIYDG